MTRKYTDEGKLEIGSFSSLDETNDPNLYIAAMDRMDLLPVTREAREIMRTAISPRSGDVILDLGCGTGTEACELAKRVAPRGKVIGLDTSAAMVAEAARRAQNLGLALGFQIGDAVDLPFSNSMFSGCRALPAAGA
jgi:ubiquinone/menaquinone biosynthesis C-methylase UbiE